MNTLDQLVFTIAFACMSCMVTAQSTNIQKQTVEYANVNGQPLQFDLYQDANHSADKTLIWMHGGGFAGGSRDNQAEVRFMNYLAKNGYNAISISYRLLQKGKEVGFGCDCSSSRKERVFREAAKDFLRAVDYTVKHAEELAVDTSTLVVGGSSAGAEAVLNAVYNTNWVFTDKSDSLYQSFHEVNLDGVVSLAGAVVDSRYITEASPPAILYHGTDDNLVPYASAPHHYCNPEADGYLWLDGSAIIADVLYSMNQSYVLARYPGARHEISGIPFNELDQLLQWMNDLFVNKEVLQLTIQKTRQ